MINTIKIKYHTDIVPIEQKENSDWIDLRSAEDVELKAGDFKLISLGVSMKLPPAHEAHVVPRSSTFKNWGIIQTNGIGVIDNSYSGDKDVWMMPVLATRDTTISKNDRVCQFRLFSNQGVISLDKVEFLSENSRNGFGSTGIS